MNISEKEKSQISETGEDKGETEHEKNKSISSTHTERERESDGWIRNHYSIHSTVDKFKSTVYPLFFTLSRRWLSYVYYI